MKSVFFAVCVMVGVGCSSGDDSPDPHELVACEGWTVNGSAYDGQCERACSPRPATGSDTCMVGSGAPSATCAAFTGSDGVRGCCEPTGLDMPIRFYECQ